MAKPGALVEKSSDKMNHDLGELITVDSIRLVKIFLFLITEPPCVLAMNA